ncbi:alpha/beta hydrolase family protein [Desulfobacula toluolica]|uniref:Conserved uncharacterized protein n=1 Tax=Desulfobacula toluolica (strain DSM 7467 / Tol2) TaxID=651182 RepID=K0NKH0_DESTT|nr:dienelactone hydrolase [Desulfobacula toluolica]CCK79267.1 conserved uncharacterized protein [Desulfobacula toluolica Tol2]
MISFQAPVQEQINAYDPAMIFHQQNPERLELVVNDPIRYRAVPVLVYLPAQYSPAPVVMFCHGLGGSCKDNAYLGQHWAANGYMAIFIQHPGSDDSIWKGKAPDERITALKGAASPRNFMLRLKDIPLVLDQLEKWNTTKGHALHERMDLDRIGMSGHSFGAMTTQAVSGQTTSLGNASFTDLRIKAAIIFSPSTPHGEDTTQMFGNVKIPWMLITGTKDIAPIGTVDMKSRLAVFPALPPGGKYELVLYEAKHSDFSIRSLSKNTKATNLHYNQAIVALSTAFWDTWLGENVSADAWLHGDGPNSVLKKKDAWQWK